MFLVEVVEHSFGVAHRDQQRLDKGPLTEYSQFGEDIPFEDATPRAGNDSGGGQPGRILKCKGWETDPNAYTYFITQAAVWDRVCDLIGKPEWKDTPGYAKPSERLDKLNEVFIAEKSTYASEFMTLCYDTRSEWLSKIPAVVHFDNTARLQTVSKDINANFYKLITAFKNITGIPLLVNTSFNLNGEPNVENPRDAIRTFFSCGLDYLLLGQFLISKK